MYESERIIQKKLKDNRGRGNGKNYQPWLYANEFPTAGSFRVRKKGKIGRIHHFGSRLELYVFLYLEKNPHILDIREQYRISRSLTLSICEKIGINHPGYKMNKHRTAQVTTIDFLVDYKSESIEKKIAISVLNVDTLKKERRLQLAELTYLACQELNYDFYIVTDYDVDQKIVNSLDWAFSNWNFEHDEWAKKNLATAQKIVIENFNKYKNETIISFANKLHQIFEAENGTWLSVIRYMLAIRLIDFDCFAEPISEQTKLSMLEIT